MFTICRLWQTVLLARFHLLFEFTPVESVVKDRQSEYYKSLGLSDKEGTAQDRLEIARATFGKKLFSRKEYLAVLKTISTATASRDLAAGVQSRVLLKTGEKAVATYRSI